MADFFGKLKSGANKVAFEADKMTRLSRAQGDVKAIKTQIDSLYQSLGELYYRRYRIEAPGDPEFAQIIEKVHGLEEDMAVKAEAVARINAESFNAESKTPTMTTPPVAAPIITPAPEYTTQQSMPPEPVNAPPAPQAESKVCPSCGFIVPAATRFCPECGNKME